MKDLTDELTATVHSSGSPKHDEPAIKLGQIVARGATFLFLSQIGSAVIALIGSVILVRLLVSPSVYAPIGLAISVPGLVMLGDATGVNASLTRYLSEYKASGNTGEIWSSFWTGFIVKALTGIILSIVAFLAAGPISILIGKPEVITFFQVAAPLPFVWVTQVNVKSVLLALEASRGYSVLQIVNEALLSVSPIAAVLLGLGALGALSYMVFANYAYLLIAYCYCTAVVLAATKNGGRRFTFVPTARRLTIFGAPLGIANSFSNFTGQIVNLLVARFVSLDIYGLYSVAKAASGFLTYAVDPIRTMLLPAYSRVSGTKESGLLKSLITQTNRYETAIVLPIFMFFIAFATPLVSFLYGIQYTGSGIQLAILAASFIPVGLASDAITTVLTSEGFTKFIGGVNLLYSLSLLITGIVTIPIFGLLGFLVASVFSFIPSYLVMVSRSKRELGIGPPLRSVARLYYAFVLTGLSSFWIALLPIPTFAVVLIGLGLVPFIFILFSGLLRAIEPKDFDRLRGMLATQSVVPRVLGPLIEFSERLVRYIRRE